MENYLAQITIDFGVLADEHEVAASNERLWAKGAPDVEQAAMHEENAETHIQLARGYRQLSNNPKAFFDFISAMEDK